MNYTVKDYEFEKTTLRYITMSDSKRTFFLLVPNDMLDKVSDNYQSRSIEGSFAYNIDWFPGSLAHLHLAGHADGPFSNCQKLSQTTQMLKFKSQTVENNSDNTKIITTLEADEGYGIIHTVTKYNDCNTFNIETEFVNNTPNTVKLTTLTSASLDGLSPFSTDDASNQDMYLHTFKGGWAAEGRHVCTSIEDLAMEKSWGGNYENEHIETIGSRPVGRHFPYMALEDRKHGVIWGMKLALNSSWQMDFSRYSCDFSMSCSIADVMHGNWFKEVKSGESFKAPVAYVAAVKGDIADLSNEMVNALNREVDAYGEEGMPITFNEWCTTWGQPSEENCLKIADKMKKSHIKYFVMDAGWYKKAIGDWIVKEDKFPNGMKHYTDAIRAKGLIPGIWMEFEAVAHMADAYKNDHMFLRRDGEVIQGAVNMSRNEKFFDFENPAAVDYLDEHVLKFLKDNGFGYLKVDYNSNIGYGVDGYESLGEGLRQKTQKSIEYFKKIKKEIPDMIIENCASGGLRLEPSMMAVTAMSSFSDAHECQEFPIIAANLHYLTPPRQNQIWCVLKPEFTHSRYAYTIAGGFLGRLCWSGDVLGMNDEQMNYIYDAEKLYEQVSENIKYGESRVYRSHNVSMRNPIGVQAVLRESADKNQILVVIHTFNKPEKFEIPLTGDWNIADSLYDGFGAYVEDNKLVIDEKTEFNGNVIVLKR